MTPNFDDAPEVGKEKADYTTIPPGHYHARIREVRVGQTRAGHERWGLQLVVASGEYENQVAAWDSIVFSHRASQRKNLILDALGVHGEVRSEDLVGLEATVQVRLYEDDQVRRNEVPYDGWEALPR